MIIGITGTLGAGKGTVVKYLVEKHGFFHASARDYLSEELTRRGLPLTRDNMHELGNEFRRDHHPGYVVEELYKKAAASGKDSVIESVRTLGEVEVLRAQPSCVILAVDAEPEIRYERICERCSSTDDVSFEKFLDDERKEMTSEDPTVQNVAKCIAKADHLIINDGSFEELAFKIDRWMEDIHPSV